MIARKVISVGIGLSVLLLALFAGGCVRSKPPRTLPAIDGAALIESEDTAVGATPKVIATVEAAATVEATATVKASATEEVAIQEEGATSTATLPDSEAATAMPTATLAPTATLPKGERYIVQDGDSLALIAARYRTTPIDIMDANGLESDDEIYVGQTLYLPVDATPQAEEQPEAAPTPDIVVHVVRVGETLAAIARRYDTTVSDILMQNPQVIDPTRLYAGTRLTIHRGYVSPVVVHVVGPGETLASVAVRYRVSMQDVVQANGLANPNLIKPGQRLIIPR